MGAQIATEKKTIAAMVRLYCRDHHDSREALCPSCAALQRYAHERLDRCPFGDDKPTCRECPIHCYRPAEKAAMQEVMRATGPRMLWRHPWLALVHLWKERFHRTTGS